MPRVLFAALLSACSGDKPPPDTAYPTCEGPEDCSVPTGAPEGAQMECLSTSEGGLCLVTCEAEADCAREDATWTWVCAPFESEEGQDCFPSCEDPADADHPCPDGWSCRSTGGGSDNRKICFPG